VNPPVRGRDLRVIAVYCRVSKSRRQDPDTSRDARKLTIPDDDRLAIHAKST
jgi:hypothetical protein